MNARRRKFAAEYVKNGFNGVQAALASGYTQNYFAAGVTAHRLLKDAKISLAVEEHLKKAKISADEVLEELSEIARADWHDFVDVRMKDGNIVEANLKLSDKLKALELAGKHHKIWDRAGEEPAQANSIDSAKLTFIEKFLELNPGEVEKAKIEAEKAFSFVENSEISEPSQSVS